MYTREARLLTRWDQHAVAQWREEEEEATEFSTRNILESDTLI